MALKLPKMAQKLAPAKKNRRDISPVSPTFCISVIIINATADHMRSPVTTLLAGEALEVINICPGSHHHLKGRDHLQMIEVWLEEVSQI